MVLTGLSTSLAPGNESGGYGDSDFSNGFNVGSNVSRGLGIIFFGGEGCRASFVSVTIVNVAATDAPTIKLRFRGDSGTKKWPNPVLMAAAMIEK